MKLPVLMLQTGLLAVLSGLCGGLSFPGSSDAAGIFISQAHAQDGDDGGDDGGGDDGGGNGAAGAGAGAGAAGGGAAGNADGGAGGLGGNEGRAGRPGTSGLAGLFALFSRSDREPEELLAAGLSPAHLNSLRQLGYTVLGQRDSRLLSQRVLRIKIPPSTRLAAALEQVRALAPKALVDYNHLYRPSSCYGTGNHCPAQVRQQLSWGESKACNVQASVGLIDTAVNTAHPALKGQSIAVLRARSDGREASSAAHGTAVAALLVGRSGSESPGLLPRARLVAVDAFHSRGRSGDRMDAFDFAAALDLLAAQEVGVINLSFAGPANSVIEQSIARAYARGTVLVAAVGNDGPAASPLFPAAYAQVIGVTAVRADGNVFRRAVQGQHVALAAPGVNIWTAQTPKSGSNGPSGPQTGPQTGTSMAAPFVTAAVVVLRSNGGAKSRPDAVRQALLRTTKDLGDPGVDVVYGHGLLQMGKYCGASAAAAP